MRIASNRLAEKGAWSLDGLKIEFEELIIEEAPIEISGFSAPEIDQRAGRSGAGCGSVLLDHL